MAHFFDKVKYRMKHHMDSPRWVKYIDKLMFKEYVRSKGIETPRTLTIYDIPNEIDPYELPATCLLKLNNGWNRNIFIKNAIVEYIGSDSQKIIQKQSASIIDIWETIENILKNWMEPYTLESHYKYIRPLIFTEEYIDPIPSDLKFFVFDGKVNCVQVDSSRLTKHRRDMYDPDWNLLNVKYTYENSDGMEKPDNLKDLIEVAELLSDNLDFVRVDLYNVNNNILASEMTFCPDSGNYYGNCFFDPPEFSIELASHWNLNGY